MSRKLVAILCTTLLLIGSHSLNAAPPIHDESQIPSQVTAHTVVIKGNAVNLLKASLPNRSTSTTESKPSGMWIQGWNDVQQQFQWNVESQQADEYSIDVLVSGAPRSRIEIAGPSNKLSLEIPEGNDHWGNNWNRLRCPAGSRCPRWSCGMKLALT